MRIDRTTFLPMLVHAAECADNRQSETITGHLRLDATADSVTVHATDYEVGGRATAPCDGDGEWSLCVPAQRLLRLVSALPDGATVTLLQEAGNRLKVETGRARYDLACLAASEYPEVADPVDGGVALDSDALHQLLARSAYCVSQDDGRPAITGVYLEAQDDTLRATATDGHRLATATMPAPGLAVDAIMHRRGLTVLRKMLDYAPTIWLVASGRNLVWRTRAASLTCRAIEANFPDYTKVIPDAADYGMRATFAAESMLAELARVAPMLPRGDAILRLSFSELGLLMDGKGDQGEAHAELDAECQAPPAAPVLGLNPAYLRDAVKALGGNVTMLAKDAFSPVLLTSDEAAGAQAVLMPMRL